MLFLSILASIYYFYLFDNGQSNRYEVVISVVLILISLISKTENEKLKISFIDLDSLTSECFTCQPKA